MVVGICWALEEAHEICMMVLFCRWRDGEIGDWLQVRARSGTQAGNLGPKLVCRCLSRLCPPLPSTGAQQYRSNKSLLIGSSTETTLLPRHAGGYILSDWLMLICFCLKESSWQISSNQGLPWFAQRRLVLFPTDFWVLSKHTALRTECTQ